MQSPQSINEINDHIEQATTALAEAEKTISYYRPQGINPDVESVVEYVRTLSALAAAHAQLAIAIRSAHS